ncbi:swr1 complex component [Vermiconidia calcicola]|uniref:Swr1 complex component n=1 Tax=Vermiconidia calcicola TaxID=1690605 RepID=A0ACC3NW30_9PEZI|nr:swr1 complex component [Vermiconidia calcicola]
MSATAAAAAAAPESGSSGLEKVLGYATDDAPESPLSELDENGDQVSQNGISRKPSNADIKIEDNSATQRLLSAADDSTTSTTLRPAPPPSIKRRESEVAEQRPELRERANNKKRKRGASPPWQFPIAEAATIKTADGRRISARFNNATPTLSEAEGRRERSSSLSAPPANVVTPGSAARSRQVSPPWKKFEVEGPTAVMVDGKRKSGRVSKELSEQPKRVSPRSDKMKKRVVEEIKYDGQQRPTSAGKGAVNGFAKEMPAPPQNKVTKESSVSDSSASTIAKLRAQIEALQPTRSFETPPDSQPKRSHKRKPSHELPLPQIDGPSSPKLSRPHLHKPGLSPETQRPSPKIKLRFTAPRRVVPAPHPNALPPSPRVPPRLSIFQSIEHFELKELQQPYTDSDRGPPDMEWFQAKNEKQAAEEGAMRRKLLREAEPGGILSKEQLSIYQDAESQPEPPKQYGHSDHLVTHALHLRHLQIRERAAHKILAKKVAHEALEFWKLKRGPTEEDLQHEADRIFKLVYKQVVVDVKAKWEMVATYVQQERLRKWEAEEEVKRQERLRKKLEWSERQVARQRGEGGEEDELGEDSDEESEESGEENMSEESSENGSQEEGGAAGEMGEEELAAYLAQREVEPPDREDDDEEDGEDVTMAEMLGDEAQGHDDDREHDVHERDSQKPPDDGQDVSMADMPDREAEAGNQAAHQDRLIAELFADQDERADEEPDEEFQPGVEKENMADEARTDAEHGTRRSRRSSMSPAAQEESNGADLSSDESTDMDSEDYDSDEDMSSTGDEDNTNDADDGDEEGSGQESGDEQPRARNSLLSLFKDEVKQWAGLPTPTTSAEGDEREHREEHADAGAGPDTDEQGRQDSMQTDPKDIEEAAASDEVQAEADPALQSPAQESPADDDLTQGLVPSPTLLRGTLRSYQHAGLDWLASLYRNGTNGILADEMGLGKTIQTIALLAHLAEEHEVWDPHLVIVPTSVILNWVAEFQKFLPGFRVLGYYGTSEERQIKRRGWVNDPHHEIKDKRGYNVVITSYNVAMQDINAIRNVQWHYLVLDEAHNIRNFNSQRWQVLIRLKTRARLLLTGTPLQNSLTELWSLLTFLTAGDDNPAHGDLEEFLSHWKEPVKEIFDRGVQTLSSEAQKVVDQLHISLRPFLLRRLKSEVEKDLPKKTESVVVCKLSKRQRQLYQEYMGLAETRRSLTQGNAVSAGKVLLSLRRVCNHPDLFDPRPIQTSFALEWSPAEGFVGREAVVRRLLGVQREMSGVFDVVGNERRRKSVVRRSRQLHAVSRLEKEVQELESNGPADAEPDPSTVAGCRVLQRARLHQQKLAHLRSCIGVSEESLRAAPVYGSDLRELLTVRDGRSYRVSTKDMRGRVLAKPLRGWPTLGRRPLRFENDHVSDWLLSKTSFLQQSVQTAEKYAERLQDTIVRFAFCTPGATAPVLDYAMPKRAQDLLRASAAYPAESDYAHESRTRTAIAFPDARLLIYDSGKLQRLTRLLRDLQAKGSRSLIFTQMTGTLNILEQFLSLLNLPYLRLDGSTPVERRQLYSAEFNRPDSKYQCMILSSRAGGIGLNLTGASSVIFYDLDWNPQMDRQCMDRAHRIGQVRDVEVFKMVSEKTVEENILRRAEQKSLLDRTVIQEGRFTTEHQLQQKPVAEEEGEGDDVAAAIDRFLGGGNEKSTTQALESVEDREDVQAAQQARKEEHQDDADFAADRPSRHSSRPDTPGPRTAVVDGAKDDRGGHLDGYMIKHMELLLRDVLFVPPAVKKMDKHGRDRGHRAKRKR